MSSFAPSILVVVMPNRHCIPHVLLWFYRSCTNCAGVFPSDATVKATAGMLEVLMYL